MHTKISYILLLLCALTGAFAHAATRVVTPDPNWTFHSSFDNQPRRVLDTPDAVYFFVHQRPYTKDAALAGIYGIPTGAVFILDKHSLDSNNGGELVDLHSVAALSGTDMRCFEVDPASGAIALTYADGGIDVVAPDRTVRFYDDVSMRNFPGASTINHVALDRQAGCFRFATNSGHFAVSLSDYSVVADASWSDAVTDINTVGDRLIAIIGGKVCQADPAQASRRSAFTPIAGLGLSGTPLRVLPLDGSSFACITLEGNTGRIYTVSVGVSGWTAKMRGSDDGLAISAASCVVDRLEHNCTPTERGWSVSTYRRAFFIEAPAVEGGEPGFRELLFPWGLTQYNSSCNDRTTWLYRNRGILTSIDFAGKSYKAANRTAAPFSCSEMHFAYSPEHGFVASNAYGGYSAPTGYVRQPAMIATFKKGDDGAYRWNSHSAVHITPDYANEDEAFKTAWNDHQKYWPVPDPRGFVLDPLFPDYVHMGSACGGISAFDFAHPEKWPVNTVPPNHYWLNKFPTCQDLPEFKGWVDYICSHALGADDQGNIWVYHLGSWTVDETCTYFYIKCLTPEGRREALENHDPTKLRWQTIVFDSGFWPNTQTAGLLLKHPRNRGKILMSVNGVDETGIRPTLIYDTKGTVFSDDLDDSVDTTADDEWRKFTKIATPDGAVSMSGILNGMLENPVNGDVVLYSNSGAWLIDPDSEVSPEGYINGRRVAVKSADGMDSEVLAPLETTSGCYDEYGRLWLGTSRAGFFGIDMEGRLVAHYSRANSPLPSDGVYGMGWNPERKSLFVSTQLGIVEVKVDAPASAGSSVGVGATASSAPFLLPAAVDADYTGTVAVRNVPDGLVLTVLDADGRRIADLERPASGVTHFDLRDADGRRLLPGVYRIADASRTTDFATLTLTIAN